MLRNNFRLTSNPKFKDPINSLDSKSKLSNLISSGKTHKGFKFIYNI